MNNDVAETREDGIYDTIRVRVRVEKITRRYVDIAIDNDHEESGFVMRVRLTEEQHAEYRIPLEHFNMTHKERSGILIDRVLSPQYEEAEGRP